MALLAALYGLQFAVECKKASFMGKKGSFIMNRHLFLVSILCALLLLLAPTLGQTARVRKLSAETASGLVFKVWLEGETLSMGQDIVIHCDVENRSQKTVYLVRKEGGDEIAIQESSIVIEVPLPVPVGHGGYAYRFSKIDRGGRYQWRIAVSAHDYKTTQFWVINIGFGYVHNISGLDRKLRPDEDPAALRGLLFSRMETVAVSGLTVDMR